MNSKHTIHTFLITAALALVAMGLVELTSTAGPSWASSVGDHDDDINELAEEIDNNNVDDDSIENFDNTQAYKNADSEVQGCIDEAEELGDNLGDYEVLECVEEY